MGWDVYALRAPGNVQRIDEIPAWWEPRPVGRSSDVVSTILEVEPSIDATDPSWLRLINDQHEIEIALGKGVQVHDVTFYVRRGDGAVPVILEICRQLAIIPYETESGERVTATFEPPAVAPPDEEDEPRKRRWWRRG